jgi:hypothetical protein
MKRRAFEAFKRDQFHGSGRNGNAVPSQAMRTGLADADGSRRVITNDTSPRTSARAMTEIRRSILLKLRIRFDSENCFRNLK